MKLTMTTKELADQLNASDNIIDRMCGAGIVFRGGDGEIVLGLTTTQDPAQPEAEHIKPTKEELDKYPLSASFPRVENEATRAKKELKEFVENLRNARKCKSCGNPCEPGQKKYCRACAIAKYPSQYAPTHAREHTSREEKKTRARGPQDKYFERIPKNP